MTDTTAPRTAAGKRLLEKLDEVGRSALSGVSFPWADTDITEIEAEAIEPLLALVRAAQEVRESAVDYGSEERFGVYPFGLFAAVEYRLAKALAALPESVRVAARKP